MPQQTKRSVADARGGRQQSIMRTIALDPTTDQVLRRLSQGRMSAFVKTLIWREEGRLEGRAEMRGRHETEAAEAGFGMGVSLGANSHTEA